MEQPINFGTQGLQFNNWNLDQVVPPLQDPLGVNAGQQQMMSQANPIMLNDIPQSINPNSRQRQLSSTNTIGTPNWDWINFSNILQSGISYVGNTFGDSRQNAVLDYNKEHLNPLNNLPRTANTSLQDKFGNTSYFADGGQYDQDDEDEDDFIFGEDKPLKAPSDNTPSIPSRKQVRAEKMAKEEAQRQVNENQTTDFYNSLSQVDPTQEVQNPFIDNSTSNSTIDGIMSNEGAATGQSTNLNSSALGRGQMIQGTRYAMYDKLGIKDKKSAEEQFKTDPSFEMKVMDTYRQFLDSKIPDNITGSQRQYMIAKGWYTGDVNYDDNKVPHPEAGNKITAGEYGMRALRKFQYGGLAKYPDGGTTNDVKNFYLDYMSSPNYKQRLIHQGYSNPDQVIKDRSTNVQNTRMGISSDGSEYLAKYNIAKLDNDDLKKYHISLADVTAHELSHAAGSVFYAPNPNDTLNANDVKDINARNTYYPHATTFREMGDTEAFHDAQASEFKADMDTLRYKLKRDNIYDTGKQQFNQDFLNKAKQKYKNNGEVQRLLKRVSDKNLIYLMNNVAIDDNSDNNTDNLDDNTQDVTYAKYGGELGDPTYDALSKVLLNRNQNLNFVDRAMNPQNYPVINNSDGTYSTHKMAWDGNNDGTASVYPTIIQNPSTNQLEQLSQDNAWNYAHDNNQMINVPSYHLADYFSTIGYKNESNIPNEDSTEMKEGGIYINPKNKGKFTEYKKRTGKTTEEALHSKDPHVRKMANFAKNSSSWKKEEGGIIYRKDQEYDLSPEELANLKSQGYKFDIL